MYLSETHLSITFPLVDLEPTKKEYINADMLFFYTKI